MSKKRRAPEPPSPQEPVPRRLDALALAALLLLVLLMLGEFLLPGTRRILGSGTEDMANQYAYWRAFGFEQLARGHLPLWNPHVFSGTPFFGTFQPALLYPPNAVFFALPLPLAINWSQALHLFLLGAFTYAWLRFLGARPLGAFTAGALAVFSGPVFWRLWAGHITMLAVMAWEPLLLLAVDGLIGQPSRKWALLAAFAGAMMGLAGYPQILFNALVAAAVYAAIRLAMLGGRAREIAVYGAAAGAGILLLTGVQLVTGMLEVAHSTRGGGLPWEYSRSSALPPEATLTWLMPYFFGWIGDGTYWGRCHAWEVTLFASVAGVALALHGARRRKVEALTVAALLLVALGSHTGLGFVLYSVVPGFSSMRGWCKFTYPMMLFIVRLAAFGLDDLARAPARSYGRSLMAAGVGLALLGLCLTTATSAPLGGSWHGFLKSVRAGGVEFLDVVASEQALEHAGFVAGSAWSSAKACWTAAAMLLASGLLFTRGLHRPLAALAIAEVLLFALPLRPGFDVSALKKDAVLEAMGREPGDYRVLQIGFGNQAIAGGYRDIWGSEPVGIRRYAEFMTFTQGLYPERPSSEETIARGHPAHRLLRLKHVFVPPDGRLLWTSKQPVLPRALLAGRYRVFGDRDSLLRELGDPAFDPASEVLLEKEPRPAPSTAGETGTVRFVDESTDHLTLEVEVQSPRLLVVTDSYHPFWRIESLEGSSQASYTVLPANYVLRAVPLEAGKHRLRMEYRPPGFTALWWVFALSWLGFAALAIQCLRFTKAP